MGSCIQLLLGGPAITKEFAGYYRRSSENVAAKLKAQKNRGIVKDPHAIQPELLEVCIHFVNLDTGIIWHTVVASDFACRQWPASTTTERKY